MSRRKYSPQLATWLLELLLSPDHDSIIGDLQEEFHQRIEASGRFAAILIYWLQTLRLIPRLVVQNFIWSFVMLKNYLLITLRNLRKYKGFSAINILGLSFSISICLIIILFIQDQMSYDRFHDKKDRIYRVISDIKFRFGWRGLATSPAPLAPVLIDEYPDVENAVRLKRIRSTAIHDNNGINIFGLYAEPTFFELFDFELESGDPQQALVEPFSVVLSKETAVKFFGDKNPVGEILQLEDTGDFVVRGVLKKSEPKSHLDCDLLASFQTLQNLQADELVNWRSSVYRYYTYLLLKENADEAQLESRLARVANDFYPESEAADYGFRLQSLTGIKLGENLSNNIGPASDPTLVYMLSGLAIIIMLAACFNYMNLSVARSLKRAKEIGVRKVIGAHRSQIIRQLLGEAVLVSFISLIIAFMFLNWLVPSFNNLSEIQRLQTSLTIDLQNNLSLYAIFIGFTILVGMLAGIYPAIYLSKFLPAVVIKGISKLKGFSAITLRKSLTVIQFSLSIICIISTIMFYRQSEYVLTADYGFNREHIVNLDLQGQNYEILRNELLKSPDIKQVSAAAFIPALGDEVVCASKTPEMDEPIFMPYLAVDYFFIENLQLRLLSGRDFSPDFATEQSGSLILTESAVAKLGLGDPQEAIGKPVMIKTDEEASQRQVIGVIKDFHYSSFEEPIKPLIFIYNPDEFNYANIRIQPGKIFPAISFLESSWQKLDKIHPVQYSFYDQQVEEYYRYLRDQIHVVGLAAVLVVVISCLGLLGMATYTVETRIKEIGVRKVLGASLGSIVGLLSRGFLSLIFIAALIGIPVAWYVNNFWLDNFSYRIEQEAGIFILGVLVTILLASLTVCSQTLRAARSNPVNTLRYE